jgi:hypothetical protein
MSSFSGSFINRGKQGGAEVLGEGRDTVTGETCIPASLKKTTWEKQLFCFPGCASLRKAGDPHLTLLVSSSHRL